MTGTVDLIRVERNDLGRLQFTVAKTDTDTENFGVETLYKFLTKGLEVLIPTADVLEDFKCLSPVFYEWAEDETTDRIPVIDIYAHDFKMNGELLCVDKEGKLLKTYKRRASAEKYFNKLTKNY